jgi:hypothetical protein
MNQVLFAEDGADAASGPKALDEGRVSRLVALLRFLRPRCGAALVSLLALLLPAFLTGCRSTTCYAPVRFPQSALSKQTRLTLLDDAVKHGEVPPDIAGKARNCIEPLAKRDPS